jgi:hypothetical protein
MVGLIPTMFDHFCWLNPQFQEIPLFDEFRWLDITGPDPGVQEVRALSVCAALGNTLAEHKSAMGCDGRGSHMGCTTPIDRGMIRINGFV